MAARAAREATVEPQEGTVLTLADVVAGAATTAADAGADLPTTLAEAVAEALRALGRISAAHPVLRAAHVLDAGACALLVVLDALARAAADERPVAVPARLAARRGRPPRVGRGRRAGRSRSCCW